MGISQENANEFARVWQKCGGHVRSVAEYLDITTRKVYERRRKVEGVLGIRLEASQPQKRGENFPTKNTVYIDEEKPLTILIGSDSHFTDRVSDTFYLFCSAANKIKPDYIILNGDLWDFPSVSRFKRRGWDDHQPTVAEEIEYGQQNIGILEDAISNKPKKLWTMGNHDIRFEQALANNAEFMEGLPYTTLKDFLPDWTAAVAIVFNRHLIVKHRANHAGIHGAFNNVRAAGCSGVTGHTHHLLARPYTDYRDVVRFWIECGTLQDIYSECFENYMEGNYRNWQEGFAVVRLEGQQVLPELVYCVRGRASLYGKPL